MTIALIILSILLIIMVTAVIFGVELTHYSENRGILSDEVLGEFLDKIGSKYTTCRTSYTQRIEPDYDLKLGFNYITQSSEDLNIIFPYYIQGVGVIPFWSKHIGRINKMLKPESKKEVQRKQLNLN